MFVRIVIPEADVLAVFASNVVEFNCKPLPAVYVVFVSATVSAAVATPVTWPLLSNNKSWIYVLPELSLLEAAEILG